jgi:hypothetical protein
VISVTLLGASGNYVKNPLLRSVRVGGCVTIVEQPVACEGKHAWYKVTSEQRACPSGQRRSEDGEFCLRKLRPVKVDIDVDIPPLRTP